VFQSYALYPHMTVRQNIAFSLDIAGVSKPEMAKKTDHVARLLQLEDYLDRKPSQLSGGQRQRVAIGRALVRDPEVFLFDEPLSNLDAKLRVQMRLEIAKLHQDLRSTMIYVTHDQVEAMTLADRIVVLDSGRIAQVGSPLDLYHRPENKFVASFIGSPAMNFIGVAPDSISGGKVNLDLGGASPLAITVRDSSHTPGVDGLEIGIRPEHVAATGPDDASAVMTGRVKVLERLGNATILYVETDRGMLVVEDDSESLARLGDAVGLRFDAGRTHLFGADGAVV
jgi:multiple sugar transport system ATP-binding protein